MLKTLTVWNFALIEHAQVEFGEGLKILTGETGAGKSILIEALGTVLGRRASVNSIRTGCEQLRVEAVFLLTPNDKARAVLNYLDIETDDNTLIISRKVSRTAKNSIIANGAHITLASLKKIGDALVDIHGQNDNLALLRDDAIYHLVDNSNAARAALDDYQKLYHTWLSQIKMLEDKKIAAQQNEQRLDMLRWQQKEITDAELEPDEDRKLENDIRRLSNVERIAQHIEETCELLSGGDEFDVLTAIARVQKNLEDIARFDNSLDNASKMLDESFILLQEVFSEICSYAEQLEFSPERLEQLQARLEVVNRMKRKYGPGLDDVFARLSTIRAEIDAVENFEEDALAIEQRIGKLEIQTRKRAAALTKIRQKNAGTISSAIERELKQLFIERTRFILKVAPTERLTERGSDDLDMLFSANTGIDPKPLSKIISGGELSRVALALKASGVVRDESPASMIFDEIDTGLGGVTAGAVAECIAKVSRSRQVLCITHLPQIACMADVHISIEKTSDGERTLTTVIQLFGDERVREIARMASGNELPQSIENAKAMLESASSRKYNR
ncbi:MAG: DNA repair protein RecN [Selenomonadaceae bacterium]|nr:DNA repair protein RecN [Selenomonadaceae bacterium]